MLDELARDLRFRVRALVRRDAMDRDLNDEVRFHLEREAEKYVAAGMTRAEAERRARLAFGGVQRTMDDTRDSRGVSYVENFLRDFRYALRGLRQHPWFTAAVVLTLGVGVGVNAAMFTVVDRLFLRPPAFLIDPFSVSRLYASSTTSAGQRKVDREFSYATYTDLARLSRLSADMAAFLSMRTAVGDGDATRVVRFAAVSASYFRFFDAHPAVGRFFGPDEDHAPAGDRVAVLGYGYWRDNFGGRDVLGQSIRVSTASYTIIGVAPPGFEGVSDAQAPSIFIPITAFAAVGEPNFSRNYSWTNIQIIVRSKPGVDRAQESADLTSALVQSWNARRAIDPKVASVQSARPAVVAAPLALGRGPMATPQDKVVLWVGLVALAVLLIACANVANLLLARSLRRDREMAMRRAIGGTRGRLIQQLLTETLVLTSCGTVVGVAAAAVTGGALRRLLVGTGDDWNVLTDARTIVFSLIVTVVAALVTGLVPAFAGSKEDLAASLGNTRGGTHAHPPARGALLVAQTALATVLLIGAGLFMRSLQNVESVPIGYDLSHLLYVETSMRGTNLDTTQSRALSDRLLERMRATPGVASATPVASVPFYASEGRSLFVTGIDSVGKLGRFSLQAGTPEYFATTGTRIVRGRGLSSADRANAPRVAVVSDAMANALWRGRDPMGQCLRIGRDTAPCTTVVGVAENTKTRSITGEGEFTYYLPLDQFVAAFGPPMMIAFFARVHGRPEDAVEAVRGGLQALMPGTSYVRAQPLHEIVDPTMRSWTSGARMFSMFGAVALVLAAIGLYGVVAFNVARRTRELGVRIALGARAADVVRMVIRDALRLTTVGVVLGVAIALAASKAFAGLLFRVSPHDGTVYTVVAILLLLVATLASAFPAARAANLDPNTALRVD